MFVLGLHKVFLFPEHYIQTAFPTTAYIDTERGIECYIKGRLAGMVKWLECHTGLLETLV